MGQHDPDICDIWNMHVSCKSERLWWNFFTQKSLPGLFLVPSARSQSLSSLLFVFDLNPLFHSCPWLMKSIYATTLSWIDICCSWPRPTNDWVTAYTHPWTVGSWGVYGSCCAAVASPWDASLYSPDRNAQVSLAACFHVSITRSGTRIEEHSKGNSSDEA